MAKTEKSTIFWEISVSDQRAQTIQQKQLIYPDSPFSYFVNFPYYLLFQLDLSII